MAVFCAKDTPDLQTESRKCVVEIYCVMIFGGPCPIPREENPPKVEAIAWDELDGVTVRHCDNCDSGGDVSGSDFEGVFADSKISGWVQVKFGGFRLVRFCQ